MPTPLREVIRTKIKGNAGRPLTIELAKEILDSLDNADSCVESIAQYLATENIWKIPLGDGVRAEAKIFGPHTAKHVKVFATLFWQISEMYVVESSGNAEETPAVQPDSDSAKAGGKP